MKRHRRLLDVELGPVIETDGDLCFWLSFIFIFFVALVSKVF